MIENRPANGQEEVEGIHDNCGLFAYVAAEEFDGMRFTVSELMHATDALKHRGQEGTGIAYVRSRSFVSSSTMLIKGNGKPDQAIPPEQREAIDKEHGRLMAFVSHNRYGTSGLKDPSNVQPFAVEATPRSHCADMTIMQNGTSYPRWNVKDPDGQSDTKVVADAFGARGGFSVENAKQIFSEVDGAGNYFMLTGSGSLYIYRDPHGFQPLRYGVMHDGSVMVASEEVAFDAVLDWSEFKEIGEIPRGTLTRIRKNGFNTLWQDPRTADVNPAACSFQPGYMESWQNEYTAKRRHEWGRALAPRLRQKGIPAGAHIVPVPASGISYAKGAMEGLTDLDVTYDENHLLEKIEPSDRTFITPGEQREAAIKGKYVLSADLKGEDVVMFDDSIVRGGTAKQLIRGMLQAGVNSLHLVSGLPPIREPCYWGTDFATHDELIYNKLRGHEMSIEEYECALAQWLCEDAEGNMNNEWVSRLQVTYQTEEDFKSVLGDEWCYHCLDGEAPKGADIPVEIRSVRTTLFDAEKTP
jgi:amidophosphoribosyltransferase